MDAGFFLISFNYIVIIIIIYIIIIDIFDIVVDAGPTIFIVVIQTKTWSFFVGVVFVDADFGSWVHIVGSWHAEEQIFR